MAVTTDYTRQQDSFQPHIFQQYRLKKYFRDVLLNWLADPDNILDVRIRRMLFDAQGNLRRDLIKTDTAFTKDSKYAGTTPSIVISGGAIQYSPRQVALSSAWPQSTSRSVIGHSRRKAIGITFSVVTQDYDGTDLLAQLLQLFLLINAGAIVKDCKMISSFDVLRLDAPAAVETATQSKHVYGCNIHTQATGYVNWTEDTQGPIFKGLIQKANFNSNN